MSFGIVHTNANSRNVQGRWFFRDELAVDLERVRLSALAASEAASRIGVLRCWLRELCRVW